MSLKFDRLDHDGLAELLKSGDLATAIHGVAEEIAAQAAIRRSEG